MLKLAALALAAATATPPQALVSDAPWWERISVVVTGDGDPQSCTYESSLPTTPSDGCDVVGGNPSLSPTSASSQDEFTRITFERRFTPGDAKPQTRELHPGDTLLGGQIMALAINGSGLVSNCKVIAKAGDVTPDYGCAEARKEQFAAAANAGNGQLGFMTIMVYGHNEHVA